MRKRMKLRKRANKCNFKYTANKVHKKNLPRMVSRGGIRL